MAAQVVGAYDAARGESGNEAMLDPGSKVMTFDRTIRDVRGNDTIMAQSGEEGRGLPVPVRHTRRQPLAPHKPTSSRGHVGLDQGFI